MYKTTISIALYLTLLGSLVFATLSPEFTLSVGEGLHLILSIWLAWLAGTLYSN